MQKAIRCLEVQIGMKILEIIKDSTKLMFMAAKGET